MFILQHPVTKKLVGVYVEEELGSDLTSILVEFDPTDCEHALFVKTGDTINKYMSIIEKYENDDLVGRYISDYENRIPNINEYVPYKLNI